MLSVPKAGRSRKRCGRKQPYAAVMHRSGSRSARAVRKASSLASGGVSRFRPSFSASSCTGDGVSFFLRPVGLGGWLTTAAMSKPPPRPARAPAKRSSSERAATLGVPRKTTRFGAEMDAALQKARTERRSSGADRRISMVRTLQTSGDTMQRVPGLQLLGVPLAQN